jgi:hypothetical protein
MNENAETRNEQEDQCCHEHFTCGMKQEANEKGIPRNPDFPPA